MRSLKSILLLVLGLLASACLAPPEEDDLRDGANYSIEQYGEALVVADGDDIIFEEYVAGYNGQTPHKIYSGSKSFTCALAAVAAQDGALTLDEPVANTITEWKTDPNKSRITIRQLLSLSSGLYGGTSTTSVENESVATAIQAPMAGPVGSTFSYGPNPFLVFAELLRRKLNEDPAAYLDRKILQPIGSQIQWIRTPEGLPNFAGGGSMRARDWLRYGQLIRDGGQWHGNQIISANGVAQCFRPSTATPTYGMGWWLVTNPEALGQSGVQFLPTRMADGAYLQRLFLVPGTNWVVIRFGRIGIIPTGYDDNILLSKLLGTDD